MAIKFRKRAIKFLNKANPEDVENIREQINQIAVAVEQLGIIPFTELDIKKMKGDWEGFYRLRVGKNRIIFTIDMDSQDIEIYAIGARGDIYKS
ncbi:MULTISPECIES: type II toxin-antitoxin system RelE family toxin [Fischerella]|uniref:Plasmid stabilization system protein n=1 Tax=Fischerella muscicola CCMEE 5323 TaxID=2019572 RepID=A0A2N6JY96_FISMU|nr:MULTISPECIES: type II toxin-antitoxin system RelE/ParE family toxin [Fischerella]MBD2434984.1 type II toxin-antitoxin system RelE/ParE family toxin [Fischerella sp. FACHB-380]PLZ85775.1 plasmid stabilization system protein [Fischerella muscicola CCMEE 5323]